MSIRVTPLQARQAGRLRGFGFSVFIDREDAPIPSQDGKTESEGLASAPVTEQPETANDIRAGTPRRGLSEVTLPTTCEEQPLSGGEGTQGTGSTSEPGSIPGQSTHSEQARVSSTALEADPAKPLPLGSWVGHPFNDTGPHVFSDQDIPA